MASLQLPQLEGTARAMGNSFGAMVPAQRTPSLSLESKDYMRTLRS